MLTGEAATTVGADHQGMVAGDLVNTASRLQSAAAPGSVLVGEPTMRAAAGSIAFEPAGDLDLKGKDAAVSAWRALRVVAERQGSNRMAIEPPFVGRAEELRMLKELLHATGREGKARAVSVMGIGGIGKSRLAVGAAEVRRRPHRDDLVAPRPLPVVRRRHHVLGARRDGADARWHRRDRPTRVSRAKLSASVAQHVPDEEERRWLEPRLAFLLGLATHPAVGATSCSPPGARSSSGSATTGPSR